MSSSLLPPNSTAFERALEQVLKPDFNSTIRTLWSVKGCPDDLLYVLALTMGVDVWDEAWSREAKERTILDAYNVHRLRGTPSSIRRILRNAGYAEVDIVEGLNIKRRDGYFTRNGHFFHGMEDAWSYYRIYLQRAITNAQAKQVRELLEETAPLHCVLMGLHYKEAFFLYNGEIMRDGTYNRGAS